MDLSFLRRVNNITLFASRPLSPLFEAVANSIDSIKDANIDDGKVRITVVRDDLQGMLADSVSDTRPVIGFEIEDNGVGFNNENLRSFQKSDSDLKPNAKGIGRLLWLKAFQDIKIDSVYSENGQNYSVSFAFQLTENGVEILDVKPTNGERKTIVKLIQYKPKYKESCPKHLRLIADKIIEHFLIHFLSDSCPIITLSDGTEHFDLNELFEETVRETSTSTNFRVRGEQFHVTHLRLYSSGSKNQLHFCAGDRSVSKMNLDKKLPNLSVKLDDENGKAYKVAAYVQSDFLDSNANAERTDFDIEKIASEYAPNSISFDQIEDAALEEVRSHLDPVLRPIAENKRDEYTRYVREEAPEFRTLLKIKPEIIESLPAGLSKEKLDSELHKLKFTVNEELKEKANEFLRKDFDEVANTDEYLKIYSEFFAQLSDFNADDLAKYVIHRKSIIKLLEKGLSPTETGKYYPEAFVHNLIFPMGTTSDHADFEKQNLWLIDERLSFHDLLASDKSLTSLENIQVDSRLEPDTIIFNRFDKPLAYAEPGHRPDSIVIIEFKRPMRKGYDEDNENPVNQVTNLINAIRSGRILDKNQRPLDVLSTTPFYAYIVCDITPRLKTLLETNHGFTPTPDPRGYFNYYLPLNAYLEVVSYNKMVDDAKKRNRVLFTRLNLPI